MGRELLSNQFQYLDAVAVSQQFVGWSEHKHDSVAATWFYLVSKLEEKNKTHIRPYLLSAQVWPRVYQWEPNLVSCRQVPIRTGSGLSSQFECLKFKIFYLHPMCTYEWELSDQVNLYEAFKPPYSHSTLGDSVITRHIPCVLNPMQQITATFHTINLLSR